MIPRMGLKTKVGLNIYFKSPRVLKCAGAVCVRAVWGELVSRAYCIWSGGIVCDVIWLDHLYHWGVVLLSCDSSIHSRKMASTHWFIQSVSIFVFSLDLIVISKKLSDFWFLNHYFGWVSFEFLKFIYPDFDVGRDLCFPVVLSMLLLIEITFK